MCRLLGLISPGRTSMIKYLWQSDCSLYRQALLGDQGDGWGIGFFSGGLPKLLKSERAAFEEGARFEASAKEAEGNVIIAHVRKASNPKGLPHKSLISVENSQPFAHENYLFAHNGTINIPDALMSRMGKFASFVKGQNDSEVYFYLLLSLIAKERSVTKAVAKVEKLLWTIFREENPKKFQVPFVSLNMMLSDGEKLYVFTRHPLDVASKSICYGDRPVFAICYRYDGNNLVVSSEKTDDKAWQPLADNHLLVCWVQDGMARHSIIDLSRPLE